MKLDKPIVGSIWEALGFPKGWGSFQPEIGDQIHFVVQLPNGIPAEALVAERVGSPGFMAYHQQGLVAGQFAFMRLTNAVGSGKKLLIDGMLVDGNSANTVFVRTGMPAGAAAGTIVNKQIGGAAPPDVAMMTGNSAAPGGVIVALLENGNNFFPDPWQLDPGTEIGMVAGAVATGLNGGFYFRQLPI